jgi:hypothetical protein
MAQQMTMAEVRARFDGEWVLLEDPETNDALDVLGGTVACHSRDRDEVYRQAVARRPRRAAVVFTGELPDGVAVVL